MTNRTDLDKCCAQIELVRELIEIPIELKDLLAKLETKKSLLMKYRTSDYATILKYFYPEKEIEIPKVKEIKKPEANPDLTIQEVKDSRDMLKQANEVLAEKEEELKVRAVEKTEMEEIAINKALEIRKLKAKLKTLQEVKEEVKEEILGE